MTQLRPGFQCEECRRIARALRAAWRADRQVLRVKFRDVAASSGRDVRQLGLSWVFSITTMPDDEMRLLLETHYPHVADARRQRDEHEAATGHAVSLHGWTAALYGGDLLE